MVRLYRGRVEKFQASRWGDRLRAAMRALAPSRDDVVTRAVLLSCAEALPNAEDRTAVRRALPHPQPPEATALSAVAPLIEELVADWKSSVVAAGWEPADAALAASRHALAKLQSRVARSDEADLWHRRRRRVKELAFQLDWAHPPVPSDWQRLRAAAWRLQSHLGALQDRHVTLARLDQLDLPAPLARSLRRALKRSVREASERAWHDRLRRRELRGS